MVGYSGQFASAFEFKETLSGEEADGEDGETCNVLDSAILAELAMPLSEGSSPPFTAAVLLCSGSAPSVVVMIVGSTLSADIE